MSFVTLVVYVWVFAVVTTVFVLSVNACVDQTDFDHTSISLLVPFVVAGSFLVVRGGDGGAAVAALYDCSDTESGISRKLYGSIKDCVFSRIMNDSSAMMLDLIVKRNEVFVQFHNTICGRYECAEIFIVRYTCYII